MRFGILGPLEVRDERGVVDLGGSRPRAILAVLLLHPNEPVSAERLVLDVWGDEAPPAAVKRLHVSVSRPRRARSPAWRSSGSPPWRHAPTQSWPPAATPCWWESCSASSPRTRRANGSRRS